MENKKRQLYLECQRECIHSEHRCAQELKRMEGHDLTYPNQKEAAFNILQAYDEGKHLVLLVAQPGAGKTGVMLEVCMQLATHIEDEKCVPVSNTFILSGMSDLQWKSDIQQNMLPSFRSNIWHRGEIPKIEAQIRDLKNGFICNDECHIACGQTMKMSQLFQKTKIVHPEYAVHNKVRILEVSATPEAIGWDLSAWGDKASRVFLQPSSSYKGFRVMLCENRIRDVPKFSTVEDVYAFLRIWEDRYASCPTKKYFPIRLLPKSKQLMEWFKTACKRLQWHHFQYDSSEWVDDIDTQMRHSPEAFTLIFIKGFWRASKRIERKHVGGCLEETPRKLNTTSAAQGLIARFCNTYEYAGDELNPHWRPLHYGSVSSIQTYLKWFDAGCDFKTADYSSTSIHSKNGKVNAKATNLHYSGVHGLKEEDIATVLPIAKQKAKPKQEDEGSTVPIVLQITEEQFRSIRPGGKGSSWNFDALFACMSPEIREELVQINRRPIDHECPDPTKPGYEKKIKDYIESANAKKTRKAWASKEKRGTSKKYYVIYLDQVEFRVIVSIYKGT